MREGMSRSKEVSQGSSTKRRSQTPSINETTQYQLTNPQSRQKTFHFLLNDQNTPTSPKVYYVFNCRSWPQSLGLACSGNFIKSISLYNCPPLLDIILLCKWTRKHTSTPTAGSAPVMPLMPPVPVKGASANPSTSPKNRICSVWARKSMTVTQTSGGRAPSTVY